MNSHLNAIQALIVYGDEQCAEGVAIGWQQAVNKLADLIHEHRDWTPNQLLTRLYIEKDERK